MGGGGEGEGKTRRPQQGKVKARRVIKRKEKWGQPLLRSNSTRQSNRAHAHTRGTSRNDFPLDSPQPPISYLFFVFVVLFACVHPLAERQGDTWILPVIQNLQKPRLNESQTAKLHVHLCSGQWSRSQFPSVKAVTPHPEAKHMEPKMSKPGG